MSRAASKANSKVVSEKDRHNGFLVPALLVCATIIAFCRIIGNDFVIFDDEAYVTGNPIIQGGLTISGIVWAFKSFYCSNWHPLTWMSHMLDWSIYKGDPGGHHFTSLLFHCASVVLLYSILKRATGKIWPSVSVAALFAIHPLHVESVAWVAERKDVLSTFFFMLTLMTYLRYVENPNYKRYLLVLAALTLGLMSKPMLVITPLVLLMLDYWPLGRFSRKDADWKRLIWEKAPMFVFVLASCIITFTAQRTGGAMGEANAFPISVRLANASIAYIAYIVKMFYPHALACFYPHPANTLPLWQVLGSTLLLIGITYAVIRSAKKYPYLAMGWTWYIVTLIPVIGLVQVGLQAMADRYTYIPLIGLFIMLTWGVLDYVGEEEKVKNKKKRKVPLTFRGFLRSGGLASISLILLLTLMACTWVQAGYWHDQLSLFQHVVDVGPSVNPVAHFHLALWHTKRGEPDKALFHCSEQVKDSPDDAEAHVNLGLAMYQLGRFDEAQAEFEKAISLKPLCADAYFGWGILLSRQSKWQEAQTKLLAGLKLQPRNGEMHEALAKAYFATQKYEEAWQEVHNSQKDGFMPAQQFLDALQSKMPEPLLEDRNP